MRSGLSTSHSTRKPSPTSPSTREAGTRTSSKKTWLEVTTLLPSLGIGRYDSVPAASASRTSTSSRVMPAVRGLASAAGVLRVTASIHSAFSTPEIQVFWPAHQQVVAVAPGGGGDRERVAAGVGLGERHAELASRPVATPGRISACCAGVPCRASVIAPNPGVRM